MAYESREPDEPDDSDRSGTDDGNWEGSYSNRDGIVPDDGAHDYDDDLPSEPGNEGHPAISETDIEGFKRTLDYIDHAGPSSFGALFAAVAKDELGSGKSGEAITEDELEGAEAPDDSLAALDAPETEEGRVRFDHDLETMAYQPALAAVGVRMNDSAFVPGLEVADGEKFAAALAAFPEGDEALRSGAQQVVSRSLTALTLAYVPPSISDEYATNHLHPTLQPEISGDPAKSEAHAALAAEVTINAPAMVPELRRLGVDESVVASLEAARLADREGMLAHWGVANEWGLYHPPTTNYLDTAWTQWNSDEWQGLSDFVDEAAVVAPGESQFMDNLASTMLSNIDRLRRGDLAPGWHPPRPESEDSDDEDLIDLDRFDWTPTDEDVAEQQRHDATLEEMEQKLRQFVR
jgi:hypothetical protein